MTRTHHELSFVKETTFGVNAVTATNMHRLEFFGKQILPIAELEANPLYATNSRSPNWINTGPAKLEGTLTFYLTDEIAFYYPLGQNAATDSGSGHLWNHISAVYHQGADKFDLPSFGLQYLASGETTTRFEFLGCKVNEFKLHCAQEEPVICEWGIMAKVGHNTGTTLTLAPRLPSVNDEKFVFKKATIWYNAVEHIEIETFDLTVSNNIGAKHTHQTTNEQYPAYLHEGNRAIGFAFGTICTGDTYLADILTPTKRDITVFLTRDGVNDRIEIFLTGCTMQKAQVEMPEVGGTQMQVIGGTAMCCYVDAKSTITGSTFMPTQS